MNVNIGDWAIGYTNQDEMVQGFIESIQAGRQTADMVVTASDHAATIGKTVQVDGQSLKPLPVRAMPGEGHLQTLIELALMTRDEAWFYELSEQLTALRSEATREQSAGGLSPAIRNRLGLSSKS